MSSIVLTDYPKPEYIRAHVRGVSTEELLAIRKRCFHSMMFSETIEAGGYIIDFRSDEVQKELEFRRAIPEDGGL